MDFSQDVFNNIVIDYSAVANQLGLHHVSYFPISALQGDNIVDPSANMPWYEGSPLLQYLEDLPLQNDHNHELPRFQVQFVIRPQTPELHDYRGYAGRIASGIYRQGEEVTVLPSGLKSRIRSIEIGGKPVEAAFAPQSVVIQLEDDLDISRGDMLVTGEVLPEVTTESEVLLCWMDEKPLQPGNKYILQHQSRQVRAMVRNLHSRVDVNTLQEVTLDGPVSLNEIVKARIKTAAPLAVDRYASLRHNGAAILVDETSNNTVAALLFT
jgi:sulfate adenylyltransferase subunit 1